MRSRTGLGRPENGEEGMQEGNKRKVDEGIEEKGVCKEREDENIRKQKCSRYLCICKDQEIITKTEFLLLTCVCKNSEDQNLV